MSVAVKIFKRVVITLNVIFLVSVCVPLSATVDACEIILGVVTIYINATNLEDSNPGTDAHTFYIMGILLCSLLCLTVIIGCYGVTNEILGMNIIYSLFVLSLLIIQYLQLRSLKQLGNNSMHLKRVENAWQLVDYRPDIMQYYESNYKCCALFNPEDYTNKHMNIPETCYMKSEESSRQAKLIVRKVGCLEALQTFYENKLFVQSILNWTLIISEALAFLFTEILCILQCYSMHAQYRLREESNYEELNNGENHLTS